MHPTLEQETIYKFAGLGKSFKVLAYAGSGKTTTMIEVCKIASKRKSKVNRHSSGILLSFNSNIAVEAKEKLKKSNISTHSSTWHALALKSIRDEYKNKLRNPLDAEKEWRLYLQKNLELEDQVFPMDEKIKFIESNNTTSDSNNSEKIKTKVVTSNTCKGYIINALNCFFSSVDRELKLDHFEKIAPKWIDKEYFVNVFCKNALLKPAELLLENIINTESICFPLSFPATLKIYQLSKPNLYLEYDYVIVDEAQDTDLVTLDILNNQDLEKLQMIVVGDSFQNIYTWRGTKDALTNVDIDTTLYLSKSFRFGADLALFASSILADHFPNFEREISGNEKTITTISEEANFDEYAMCDAIITRTNAGAFQAFVKVLAQNPYLDISIKIDFNKISSFISDFEILRNKGKLKSESPLFMFESIEELEIYVENNPTDSSVSSYFRLIQKMGLDELKEYLIKIKKNQKIKKNSTPDLVIATAHSSKGLEWDNVLLYEDFSYFLFKYEKISDGITTTKRFFYNPLSDEEVRLFYVAATRAKKNLILENFPLLILRELVDKYVKNSKSINSIEDSSKKAAYLNDLKLCHSILIDQINPEFQSSLKAILNEKNIVEILGSLIERKVI